MKRIVMGIVGVVLGFVAGSILMTGVHMVSWLMYPPPEGVDMFSAAEEDREVVNAWIATLPMGAMLFAIAAHGLGAMAGAAVAMLVTGRRSITAGMVLGVIFTIAGIYNLTQFPHPTWFPFVDVPIYLVLAYVACRALRRTEETG